MKLGSLPICLKVHLYIVLGGFKCSISSLLIFWEKADGVNDPVHSLIGLINSLSFKVGLRENLIFPSHVTYYNKINIIF